MDLQHLIAGLSRSTAYPETVEDVQVIQTHISVVFLAGRFAYKIRKPIHFQFADFSTLEKRLHDCQEEVRLNRRMAPNFYLGVVPLVVEGGQLRVEGAGEAVEWAVKMQRLPPGVTLHERLQAGEVTSTLIETLAKRVAEFHQRSPAPPEMCHHSRANVMAGNVSELFAESQDQRGITVSRVVFERLGHLFRVALDQANALLEERSRKGRTRDAHGDLHLEHICVFPDREPPEDLLLIDCIEFSDRLRFIDPIADMAFVAMDLAYHGRRDLSRKFADAYFQASQDEDGRSLLPLLTAYRATVRGAVEGMKLSSRELLDRERDMALSNSRGHWLLALGELECPRQRPCLVLVAGLPGTGKSRLAQALAQEAGLSWVRSDEVRKALAGVSTLTRLTQEGYTGENTEKTYRECLRLVEEHLFAGRRVVVDATFRREEHRRLFLETAVRWGVRSAILACEASPTTVQERLRQRKGDASDADWSVYLHASEGWEAPGPTTLSAWHKIDTDGPPLSSLAQARAVLVELGLRG